MKLVGRMMIYIRTQTHNKFDKLVAHRNEQHEPTLKFSPLCVCRLPFIAGAQFDNFESARPLVSCCWWLVVSRAKTQTQSDDRYEVALVLTQCQTCLLLCTRRLLTSFAQQTNKRAAPTTNMKIDMNNRERE